MTYDVKPLPPIDPQVLDEYCRQRENERRRQHYRRHPEQVEQQRIRTYTRFLLKHGRLVLDTPPAPPWTTEQQAAILDTLAAALDQQKVVAC